MAKLRFDCTLFLNIVLLTHDIISSRVPIRNDFLVQFLSRLAEPASLEIWGKSSLANNIQEIIARTPQLNLTLIHRGNLKSTHIYTYTRRVMLKRLSHNVRSYIWVDGLKVEEIATHLEILLYFSPKSNFILNVNSGLKLIPAGDVFCRTIELIWSPGRQWPVVGFPERSAYSNGCSHWRLYEEAAFKTLYPFRVPWLPDIPNPRPSLRNAVIGGTCLIECSISNGFGILSQHHNFTITDCSGNHFYCEFFEMSSQHTALDFILAGIGLALNTFQSHSLAFLAPKGTLYPKWEYIVRCGSGICFHYRHIGLLFFCSE